MDSLSLLRKKAKRIKSEVAYSSKIKSRAYTNAFNASATDIPSATSESTLKIATVDKALQRGSIESGLVLIPTTLFFLMALQVLLAGSWQTIERARLHDLVIESSIKESLGGSSPLFEGDSTYLSGGSLSIRAGTMNGQEALLNLRDELLRYLFSEISCIQSIKAFFRSGTTRSLLLIEAMRINWENEIQLRL